MANRYWRGGTGTWNSTNTTNWSATSGGAGGASVPTAADAVIFNASSGGGVCSISNAMYCYSINTTGYTGQLQGVVSYNILYVAGSAGSIVLANNTLVSQGLYIYVTTSGTVTVNTGNNNLGRFGVTNGAATLASNLLAYSVVLYTSGGSGTFTQGSYQIGTTTSRPSINAGAVGSSVLATWNTGTGVTYASDVYLYSSAGVTGTGTIDIQIGYAGTSLTIGSIASGKTLTPTFSFASVSAGVKVGLSLNTPHSVTLSGNVTLDSNTDGLVVTTTEATSAIVFTNLVTNASATQRKTIANSVGSNSLSNFIGNLNYGLARTNITFTSAAGLGYCDFVSINSATAISPTSAGNGGNNTNITFPAGVTRYAIPGGSRVWNSTASWSTSSGGAGGASIPLPQDTVIFDANSGTSGNWQSYYPSIFVLPNINATAFPYQLILSAITGVITRDLTSSTNLPIRLQGHALFQSGTYTLTNVSSTYFLLANNANVTASGLTSTYMYLDYGTITNTGTWTTREITGPSHSGAGVTTTFNMGTGTTIDFTAIPSGFYFVYASGFTVTGSPNLIMGDGSYNYGTNCRIQGITPSSWGKLTIRDINYLALYGDQTFSEIVVTQALTNAQSLYFEQGRTYTIGKWTADGNATTKTVLTSHNAGSPSTSVHYLAYSGGGVAASTNMNISYSSASPANTWYAGATSTNSGGNSGWIFANAPTGNGLFFGSNF